MQNGPRLDFSSWVSSTSSPDDLVLGEPGFSYADLFDPVRLAELTARFFSSFEAEDAAGFARFSEYRACRGEGMSPESVSEALLAGAPHLSRFVARLFRVDREAAALRNDAAQRSPLWAFKKDFAKARLFKPNAGKSWTGTAVEAAHAARRVLVAMGAPTTLLENGSIDEELAINGITWLPIEKSHCLELMALPRPAQVAGHRDPFDRLLIAQARAEGLSVLSADPNFGRYDVAVLW